MFNPKGLLSQKEYRYLHQGRTSKGKLMRAAHLLMPYFDL